MTEFMFVPIWMLLSWLVRQVEGELDEDEIGQDAADPGEPYEPAVQLIKIGIAAFSLLLLGLSVTAYRKTRLKSIVYAAIAFGLFAAQLFFDYLEDAVAGWEQPFNDVIFYAMTLAILVLFFLAIVRRK
jgi:hypothetical protein